MTKLDNLLECIRKPQVYIQMHNYPDQDAIASAIGLKVLLESKNKSATIVYHGVIDKDNTLMMINLLNIALYPIREIDIQPDDEIIIVDGQKGNINMINSNANEIACIDHHRKQNTNCYMFYDIRSEVGACSSIIASYYIENNIPIPCEVATALIYGQRIDTSHMTRNVSDLDINMFYHLHKVANHIHLRKIETSLMNINDLENYQIAINSLMVNKKIGVANVGNNCSEAMIGSISDFLLTLSDIDFTLLYSYRVGGVKFSVRGKVDFIDVSVIIREALKGYGDGGGHADMAAGFIPDVPSEEEAIQLANLIRERFITLVTNTIIDSEKKSPI